MDFDLKQYLGQWYEIASIPQRYQKECMNVSAKYVKHRGYIEVINECIKEGKKKKIKGEAFLTDDPMIFKVKFFWWQRPRQYKIVWVDPLYQYAIVASGKRGLWIIGRNHIVTDDQYRILKRKANQKGYKVGRLQKTAWGDPDKEFFH